MIVAMSVPTTPPPPAPRRAPRPRALRILAALAVVAAAALALLQTRSADREPEVPPLRGGELPAEALAQSIGVVVHLNYVDTAYGRQAEVVGRLRQLGVGHVREAMPTPPVGPLADGLRTLRGAGIRAMLGTGDPNVDPEVAVRDSVAAVRGAIDAFEGPNELDNSADASWPKRLRDYMPRLEAAVRRQAPGTPLVGPSFVNPASRRLVPAGLPGLPNGHPYPGGNPPETVLRSALDELDPERRGGVVFSETGYHNALEDAGEQPPASEEAAAVYLPRLLITAFGAGVRRTFVYELLDEKPDPGLADMQQHFGLLRNDLSPKPAFLAIQRLIDVMQGTAANAGSHGRLAWGLDAGDEEVERLTLVRRDGSHVLALWRPVSVWDEQRLRPEDPGRLPVELSFGRPVREVAVWRPSVSASPAVRRGARTRLRLELGGDLVLVSVR
jgi:hypothetical protein